MVDLKKYRQAGIPLIGIETNDPQQTIDNCIASLGDTSSLNIFQYDAIRETVPLTENAKSIIGSINPSDGFSSGPIDVLKNLAALDAGLLPGIVFWHQFDKAIDPDNDAGIQAIWNLRDQFKSKGWLFVGLAPSIKLPPMLKSDVIIISEPIPTEEKIGSILDRIAKDARLGGSSIPDPIPDKERETIVDNLMGLLSDFDIEQTLSLSITKNGIDIPALYDRKCQTISQVKGLTVHPGQETFDDLAGCKTMKSYIGRIIEKKRPRVIFHLDEIEKMVAGGRGDTSGTSQSQIGMFLSWTEDKKVDGILLLGVPGAGKTFTSKCSGGEAKCPVLLGSLSEAKEKWVGSSEQNLKSMLDTVQGIGQGKVLMLATCNSVSSLTPEIMARFKLGIFFYDFPDYSERSALWDLYRKKYGIDDPAPLDRLLVGREIESACYKASVLDIPLKESLETVVPIYQSNREVIEAGRKYATNRFLSASYSGAYIAKGINSLISKNGNDPAPLNDLEV